MTSGAKLAAASRVLSDGPMNLASVDLNLLVALDALLQHCNVTHAANTVGLSQPAMSRILARLRGMFDDELLVRASSGYVRTMMGDWLFAHLPQALDSIRKIVCPQISGADDWLATVRLAMPDHQALVLGKPMVDRMWSGGKQREVDIEPVGGNVHKRLEAGDLEMVVGEVGSMAAGFYQRSLYVDDYTCLLRLDHPALASEWTAERFYDLQHVVSSPAHDGEPNHVVDALRIVPTCCHRTVSPNTMGAAMAVLESDMVLTVPRRVATKLAAILHLEVKDPPIKIVPYRVTLLWHERSHRDAEHEWLRAQIAAAATTTWSNSIHH